jgi:hypothetical protein
MTEIPEKSELRLSLGKTPNSKKISYVEAVHVSKYVDSFQEVHGDAADFRGRGAKNFQGYRLHRVGHVRKKFKTIFLSILVLTPSEEAIVKKKDPTKKF